MRYFIEEEEEEAGEGGDDDCDVIRISVTGTCFRKHFHQDHQTAQLQEVTTILTRRLMETLMMIRGTKETWETLLQTIIRLPT